MRPRISLITLGVRDLERSRRFYKDGLGLPENAASNEGVAFFEMRGAWLGLYPRHLLAEDARVPEEGSGFTGVTIAHNRPSKGEVDATIAEAVAAGATLVKPAEDVSWGGYSGYFSDPDGFLWEVAWNPFMPELAE
ncbi:MAG TPA: VOC family protein [Dehalococcoidia bacterium]|nr:VOC family protein [Dehalococcoidia bacterium]